MHPNGYTREMLKEILGTSWPTMPEDYETGNQMRRRMYVLSVVNDVSS